MNRRYYKTADEIIANLRLDEIEPVKVALLDPTVLKFIILVVLFAGAAMLAVLVPYALLAIFKLIAVALIIQALWLVAQSWSEE